jgi:hypothetical protein
MVTQAHINAAYEPSEKIVPRLIRDRLIIVPIEDGMADFSDAMYSFNETGTRIWECISERQPLDVICRSLAKEYDAEPERIREGVLSLVTTLLEKGIVREWKN